MSGLGRPAGQWQGFCCKPSVFTSSDVAVLWGFDSSGLKLVASRGFTQAQPLLTPFTCWAVAFRFAGSLWCVVVLNGLVFDNAVPFHCRLAAY